MEERTINLNNLDINYKIAGEGEPLLILHGWGGSSDSWIKVQKLLAMAGYQVIIPDFPGFGKSKTPSKPWGVGDYADFVLNFIENFKIQNLFILGHSFGGRIAIKFAVEYPDKIKGLILCDSAGIKPKADFKTRIIFEIARIGNAVFTPKHLVRLKDWARNIFYIFLRRKDYVKAKGTMKDTIKQVFAEDLLPELPKIKKRVLIVWGEADKMVPLRYGRMFKEKILGSEIKVLPKIGHSPHLECPEELAGIILKFLKG